MRAVIYVASLYKGFGRAVQDTHSESQSSLGEDECLYKVNEAACSGTEIMCILFLEVHIRLLTSILEQPFPESMGWSTREMLQMRPQDSLALLRQYLPWWSLRHQDIYADHSVSLWAKPQLYSICMAQTLEVMTFYQRVSFESMYITMCTECKTVTASLMHADHLNSVTSATDVHLHERFWHSYLPIHVVTHIFKVSE